MAARRQDPGADEQVPYSLAHFQGQNFPELSVNCLGPVVQMYEYEMTLVRLNSICTRSAPRWVLERTGHADYSQP